MRCDVVVVGLGLAGRAVFRRLAAQGVDVVGVDPRVGWVRPGAAPLFDTGALGLHLPCHLELPSRFDAAMGVAGAELVAAVAAQRDAASDALFEPVGVRWTTDAPEAELAACGRLGLRAQAAPGGFRLLDAGVACAEEVRVVAAEPAEGELTLICTAFSGETWLADKVMPVRWQSIAVEDHGPVISRAGSVFSVAGRLCGARWATAHMEVGETVAEPSPAVTTMLERLAQQDGIATKGHPAARAGIVAESCDGLPIVGPLPGRPRVGVLTGLGVAGRTYLPLAAEWLVASVLGSSGGQPLPTCLGTARFR
jgi:glycine/D-amino acid oxidase-like deaminating enzyme